MIPCKVFDDVSTERQTSRVSAGATGCPFGHHKKGRRSPAVEHFSEAQSSTSQSLLRIVFEKSPSSLSAPRQLDLPRCFFAGFATVGNLASAMTATRPPMRRCPSGGLNPAVNRVSSHGFGRSAQQNHCRSRRHLPTPSANHSPADQQTPGEPSSNFWIEEKQG